MTNTTLPTLSAGTTIQTGDLFITRQGADTVDKKITGTQIIAFVNANATINASALAGSALASGIITSSLTSVGTITTGVWNGTVIGDAYIVSASTWNAKLSNITNLVTQGSNITITGSGTFGDPYVIAATAALSSNNTWTGQQTFNTLPIILGTATANTALVTDNNKKVISSSTTDVEIGYVHGVTSAIQTQINSKQATGNYLTALTGDATAAGPGSSSLTLATVNANVGSFGSASSVPSFTVNGKGLVTAAGSTTVIAPAGTLTGTILAANVVSSSLTSTGTLTGGATGAGFTLALAAPTITGVLPAINGVMKANGSGTVSQATAGTDYSMGTSVLATGIVKSTTSTGALTIAVAGDFPTLNQNTTGNAATVTTNANLTGPVTSTGNTTAIANGTITNAMLAVQPAPASITWDVQSANYTLVLSDASNGVRLTSSAANTLTVPPHSSVAFLAGAQILGSQFGTGQTTIAPGAGVTILTSLATLKTRAQYSSFALIQTDIIDTWILTGDMAAS